MVKPTLCYKVVLHPNIDDKTGKKLNNFTNKVREILKHPKGWNINFKYIPNSDTNTQLYTVISLTPNEVIEQVCGINEDIPLSCAYVGNSSNYEYVKPVHINQYRWKNGSKQSKMSLNDYRHYVINHEIGHTLGFLHEPPRKGCKCPVMHQQTKYVEPGLPNPFPTKKEQQQLSNIKHLYRHT